MQAADVRQAVTVVVEQLRKIAAVSAYGLEDELLDAQFDIFLEPRRKLVVTDHNTHAQGALPDDRLGQFLHAHDNSFVQGVTETRVTDRAMFFAAFRTFI